MTPRLNHASGLLEFSHACPATKQNHEVERERCLACPSDCCFHPPRSHHGLSFSHHVCCDEVLLLARMRQLVGPASATQSHDRAQCRSRPQTRQEHVATSSQSRPSESWSPSDINNQHTNFKKKLLHHLWHTENKNSLAPDVYGKHTLSFKLSNATMMDGFVPDLQAARLACLLVRGKSPT